MDFRGSKNVYLNLLLSSINEGSEDGLRRIYGICKE